MRATRFSEITTWHANLRTLRASNRCPTPGFFKPYHFVTMALLLKEMRTAEMQLPPKFVEYAARMRLWEAIGLTSPIAQLPEKTGSLFHEITPLTSLESVDRVADTLTALIADSTVPACNTETRQSLFIMLTELLVNCYHHARSADGLHGLVCGQTWYQGTRAQVAIADSGIGIRASLAENPDLAKRLSKSNACALATQLGISSKLNRGHAGYGLTVARDLARLTPGASLFVQSCAEAVRFDGGRQVENEDFQHALTGTLVVFEWDTKRPLDITSVYEGWAKTEEAGDEVC